MITFSRHGNYGRMANQIFQLAALDAFATRYNTEYQIPKWKYSEYFVHDFPESLYLPTAEMTVKEPHYRYAQDFFDQHAEDFRTKTVDILGYFQNEKYFNPNRVKELFKFKPEIVEQVKEKYKSLFTKPTIGVGVRRTDYVTSGQYHVLPPRFYLLALQKFENYRDCNIVFITDDINYVWFHYKSLPNVFFPKFESDAEQFICGTLMTEGWITANSTFHWWSAYLSNCKRVIQPAHLFAGDLLAREGNESFYIENDKFEIFNHEA